MWPLSSNADDAVFSPAVLQLGECHWFLLKASQLLEAQKFTNAVAGTGGFTQLKITEFGEEVGRDEINWWVFKKELDLPELQARTERALEAVQELKSAAMKLKGRKYESYLDLLAALRDVVDAHSMQVDEWCKYVHWLYERDHLAPSILFAYRVWGSTRAGERSCELNANDPAEETVATPQLLARLVLGLRRGNGLNAWDKAYLETANDEWERVAGSGSEADFNIDLDEVLRYTTSMVTDGFGTYVEEIRDSLRNILLDIDACLKERSLIGSDRFWRRFVTKAAASKKVETELWDFKETLTMWRVSGALREDAKVTFAEEFASFANRRGGVLIVGVTDSTPRNIVGIGDSREIENRLKSTSDALATRLDYPRDLATIRQVIVKAATGHERSCAVVIAAQACEAVGVRGLKGEFTYPVRRATGISREAPSQIGDSKIHMKSDNHEFLRELARFVDED